MKNPDVSQYIESEDESESDDNGESDDDGKTDSDGDNGYDVIISNYLNLYF